MNSFRATLGHAIERTPAVVLLFVIFILVSAGVSTSVELANDIRASRIETSDVFEYVSVQYEGVDPELGLAMSSTASWHRDVDAVTFVDVLYCSGAFVSSYTSTRGVREASPLGTVDWFYQEEFPTDGRQCRLVAEITAEYRGRLYVQTLESVPFRPTEGDLPK